MSDTDQHQEDDMLSGIPSTPPKPHTPRKESTDEIELRPDGEARFRKAVHAAVKSGPMHRPVKR